MDRSGEKVDKTEEERTWKLFLADYVQNSSDHLDKILSSRYYTPFDLQGAESEFDKVEIGDIVLLKFIEVSMRLNVAAAGIVEGSREKGLVLDWRKLDHLISIPPDKVYERTFTELQGKQKLYLEKELVLNKRFVELVKKAETSVFNLESGQQSKEDIELTLEQFDDLMYENIDSKKDRGFYMVNVGINLNKEITGFDRTDPFSGLMPNTPIRTLPFIREYKQGDLILGKKVKLGNTKEDHYIAFGYVLNSLEFTKWPDVDWMVFPDTIKYRRNDDIAISSFDSIEIQDVKAVCYEIAKKYPTFLIETINRFNELDKLYSRNRDTISSLKIGKIQNLWWLNISEKWIIDELEVGDIENYAARGAKGKYQAFTEELRKRDLMIGYQAKPDKSIVGLWEIVQTVDEGGDYYFKLIHKFEDRTTLEELRQLPLFAQSPLSKSLQGSLHKLDKELFKEILSTTELKSSLEEDPAEKDSLVNNFFRTHIDNDNAYTSKDLLDIENDVRSFALLLAARDIKPPLAIALFGRWGSGKSFFMKHLASRVAQLSTYQGFIEESSTSNQTANTTQSDLFCKGIAQIEFNAWSYLDANLWAGLISSIFEKLDEYISDRSKGEEAKLEIRKKLSEKLHVLASEKQIIEEKKEDLIKSKKSLSKELNELKASKSEILRKVADIKLDDLFNMVRMEVQLNPEDQNQLEQYGFSPERIRSMNPNALNEEVQSWITFARSVFQFSPKYIFWFSLCFVLVVFIAFNPEDIVTRYIDALGRKVLIYAGIVLPVLSKWYDSFSRFKELVKPVSDYKNEYNRKMEEAHFEYQKDIDLLEANLISKDHEIADKAKELEVVKKKIEAVEYSLDHFLAQRAFNDFVRRKITDRQYDSHLGLISIIRRDFETLSDLFSDIQVDEMASPEVQLKQEKTKAEHDELSVLFEDEKTLDRIILYIDDLDRCSDDKVLEVIQAVHLLMAFPLFNVIVGVDKRCVRNALLLKTKLEYRRIAPIDEIEEMGIEMINPGEYLEKIFQIPFELKDPTGKDVKHLVNSLLETSRISLGQIEILEQVKPEPNEVAHTQVDKSELIAGNKEEEVSQEYIKTATRQPDQFDYIREETEMDRVIEQTKAPLVSSAPENLQLTREELTLLPEIMFLVGSTPRTIKRYLNIYKLIRSHAMLKYQQESQQDVCLFIMFLLAMGIGNYRGTAKDFFNKLIQHHDKSLSEILSHMNKEGEKDDKVMELEALSAQIAAVEGISKILTFTPDMLDGDIIPFVSRFSFAKETVIEV